MNDEFNMSLMAIEDLNIFQYERNDIIANAQLDNILSAEELKRADAFISEDDKQWFKACRVTLRKQLANALTCEPQAINFQYNVDKKPFLAIKHRSLIQFNLSHTKDRLLIALHGYKAVGVDIEKIQNKDHLSLAKRFFHDDEVKIFFSLSEAAQTLAFYRLWVIKESIAKAKGIGLFQVMQKISVQGFANSNDIIVPEIPNAKIELLRVPNLYCAAICLLSD